jgi:hypothetical protein
MDTLPKMPAEIDLSQMTEEQFRAKMQKGYDDFKAGRIQNAATAFDKARENHMKNMTVDNAAVYAMKTLQKEMEGQAYISGLDNEDAIDNLVADVRGEVEKL